MKSMVYRRENAVVTAAVEERPRPVPGEGEALVRVVAAGVNPIDAKSRTRPEPAVYVPGHDGAGVVEAVGPRVDPGRVGQRVWLWGAGWQRGEGTAQEYVCMPAALAVALPDDVGFDAGACVGIPALTAHRCLTVGEPGGRLAPGALAGATVLVQGGAGGVGNAAVQLARWAGAHVVATVSSPAKAELAKAAGADDVVDYRAVPDPAAAILDVAPGGVDLVVEVAVAQNADIDRAVLAPSGTVAFYASLDSDVLVLPVREQMSANRRWHGVFLYTIPDSATADGVAAVSAALAAGELRAVLPLHRFALTEVAAAHDAMLDPSVVGKPLISIEHSEESP